MPRVRKLAPPGRPVGELEAPVAVTPLPAGETAPQGAPGPIKRGRRLVRRGEHPAVAQFEALEAKARVRLALESNPRLQPTAFTHRPGYEGGPLTALEAGRVIQGKSIKPRGTLFSMTRNCTCSPHCTSRVAHQGMLIPLWEPSKESKHTRRVCIVCQTVFHGEEAST